MGMRLGFKTVSGTTNKYLPISNFITSLELNFRQGNYTFDELKAQRAAGIVPDDQTT
jgi:hypothetical protein